LIQAAIEMDSMRSFGEHLNLVLNTYSERLEILREKIEGAARLHHLIALQLNEDDVQMEMRKLAEKIGLVSLMQNTSKVSNKLNKVSTAKMTITTTTITTSTPKKDGQLESLIAATSTLPAIEESPEKKLASCTEVSKACQEEDEEEDDTMATLGDSGLGNESFSLDEKDSDKNLRTCSCESIANDVTLNACDNLSQHDEDDYDTSENVTSLSLDEPMKCESASVPLQANSHLYCHASNLQLDLDDSIIDPKTQK
jgi:pleckstrin homology domain-containing family G member 4